MKKEKGFVLES